jgi:hypothetical protein
MVASRHTAERDINLNMSTRKKPCCDQMAENLSVKCDIHVDEYECPDCLIAYSRKYNEYGIIVHDGGTSYVLILYCPWCGAKLPESKREQ